VSSPRVPLYRRLIEKPRDFVYQQLYLNALAFARIEASSGLVLLLTAITALVWANSPWSDSYFDFWGTHISVDADILHIDLSLQHWVNDGLMTLFFFLMGLEIKRELVRGELSSPRRALLPAAAALGGMIAPALIYTVFNLGAEGSDGWGVPMATDIAFALGVLSLLSRRIPFSVRVFLLALAIADDIGAIVVIAVFYTAEIDFLALGTAAGLLAAIYVLNRAGVRQVNVFIALGVVLWVAVLESGVHATIAGVLLGLMTPAGHFYNPATFADSARDMTERYTLALQSGAIEVQQAVLGQIEDLARDTEAPVERLERVLHHWVSFSIVPLFALANAGMEITSDVASNAVSSPVSQGVFVGLLIGKPLGIFLMTFLAVRLKMCDLPNGSSWTDIVGVGILAGIGFTVSLLITGLGFDDPVLVDEAKLSVLSASVIAGVSGLVFLYVTSRPVKAAVQAAEELAQ
jgi:NhaA family Na+:H+ antiporter